MNSLNWVLVVLGLGLLLPFPLYALVMSLRPRRNMRLPADGVLPGLSVIVVVRDAAALIEAKLRNLLEQDYPADLIEIIVYTDGCSDNTAKIVRAVSSEIRVIECGENHGKIHGMNRAVRDASQEILVFSDADALLAPCGLRGLVKYFLDPDIGGVCARRVIIDQSRQFKKAQDEYISFDNRIKLAENCLGSISSNDGKLYAMRRICYRQIPVAVTDDLYTAMLVVRSGKRFIFAPKVTVRIATPSRGIAHEMARRRRIVSTSLRGIWISRELLNPRRYGWYAFSLFLNKVMRRMMPLGLLPLGVAMLLSMPFFSLLAGLAIGTLLLARPCLPAGGLSRQLERFIYVIAGLYGTLMGLYTMLCREAPANWQPYKQDDQVVAADKLSIAYTMSRFPKITETFVLYEMLAVEHTGLDIQVFPLLLVEESTEHPEVAEIMPKVHFAPFISFSILRANLCWFLRSPRRYLGAWRDALRSAWPNRNFLLGALGVLPKSALYALQMQQMGIAHVHAHFATHPALAARFIHSLSGIPYSFTAHGHDVHISLQGFDAKARDAQFWITISQYNLDLVAKTFNASLLQNAHLAHCGIDLTRLQPSVQRDDDGMFRMLCVASFKEVKGHTYLVAACSHLQKVGIRFHCRLIGDGPLRHQVEQQIASARLGKYFTLSGQQPHPVVIEAMCNADVVVLPSILASRGDREGIPVCLMEAMALERPVVSSNLSGIPELVTSGQEGLLVEQKDSDALANALKQLAHDPKKRVRMGANGRQKIARDFDLFNNAGILADLLKASLRHRQEEISGDQSSDTSTTEKR
jgi:colanic acid/amylovoran biosynthesis glycosyltransferase